MRMPMSPRPLTSLAAVASGLILLLALAPAVAVAQGTASAVAAHNALPGHRFDPAAPLVSTSEGKPLLPWTPVDQMQDREDAMAYWNQYFRGGRISFGFSAEFVTFTTVSSGEVNVRTDEADLAESHINIDYGIVLVENLRIDVGVGTTLLNLQPLSRNNDGYDVYGWGINYRVSMRFAPILAFLPKMVLPEVFIGVRGFNAKNSRNLGSVNSTLFRIALRVYVELAGSEDFSLTAFVGGGYQYYNAYLNSLQFNNESNGGDEKAPLPDLNFHAGLLISLGRNLAIRLEGNNLPSVMLSIEMITE